MKVFEFNEQGVCMNSEIIYYDKNEKALAWAYIKISICEYKGNWDFGYWTIGGVVVAAL